MIDRATIQRITDAADIVEVVKEFVTLRKAGTNYKGLCPFHNEKTPSFVVSPAKQLCKCFSCGKGGNAVHFIMEHEQMSYPEALRWLAKKYGIEVQERELTDEERTAASLRESLFVLNDWACKYFEEQLHESVDGVAIGMSYFRQRGFRDDIIRKFRLGYCPTERDALARAAQAKGYSAELLEKTGLCYRTDDGRLLDRFHGRVIFPVRTVSGMTVAFGGRIMSNDKKTAKYVNSPESEIYSKSHELYGLYPAKHAIVKANRCFLVEGYTDVISMHQSGIENVVASSGTSLTEGQIRLLHRFTNNITVLYDGDSAGIKASLRGIDMLLAEGLNIKVLLLPDGEDPDSFARKHKAEEFQAYIDANQVDFIRFKANLLLEEAGGDPVKRAALVQDVVRSVSVIPDDIVRQMYIAETARLLDVKEGLVTSEVGKNVRARRRGENPADEAAPQAAETPAETAQTTQAAASALQGGDEKVSQEEETLVAAIIRLGTKVLPVEEIEGDVPADFTVADWIAAELADDELQLNSELHRRILHEACTVCKASGMESLPYFLAHPDEAVSRLAVRLGTDRYELCRSQRQGYVPESDRLLEYVPRLIHAFKSRYVRSRMKALLQELARPEVKSDRARCEEIMREYQMLSQAERGFAQALGERVVF